ncbi:glycoside hydrolase family 25 protein [Riemerella columbina]|uniref:glycoside hydrolase family 25 protein n=1 Tax=Riemerella columbina TaxID=103810 RepID=UPI0003620C61|nr:GH25 family lysozyme [Riemerella columbina]
MVIFAIVMPKRKNFNKNNRKQHQQRIKAYNYRKWVVFFILMIALVGTGMYLKQKLAFYYALVFSKPHRTLVNSEYETKRINSIVTEHQNKLFGIDISHYQRKEDISWDSLSIVNGDRPIHFILLRATMGNASQDKHFSSFWTKAKQNHYTRGAYHFYRPDENPIQQANNFLSVAKLEQYDLIPVLDLEKIPKRKTHQQYIKDIKVWLDIVEKAYGKKPIIYTYYHFYKDYLKNNLDADYPLWLANYNFVMRPSPDDHWQFWQFSEQGIVKGINTKVDLNVFNGDEDDFKLLLID